MTTVTEMTPSYSEPPATADPTDSRLVDAVCPMGYDCDKCFDANPKTVCTKVSPTIVSMEQKRHQRQATTTTIYTGYFVGQDNIIPICITEVSDGSGNPAKTQVKEKFKAKETTVEK